MERPTCATCAYWVDSSLGGGQCRRMSPQMLPHANMEGLRFPFTSPLHWCGEHPDFPAYIAATRPPASPAAQAPDPAPRTTE
jgi:hypothetical protein